MVPLSCGSEDLQPHSQLSINIEGVDVAGDVDGDDAVPH
jgi:hypothetical protein